MGAIWRQFFGNFAIETLSKLDLLGNILLIRCFTAEKAKTELQKKSPLTSPLKNINKEAYIPNLRAIG